MTRLRTLAASESFQGLLMAGAMMAAGGFDALVSILAGRWLPKEQFAVFVAVTALLQVVVQLTNVIRNVVAYYTAEFTVSPDVISLVRTFFQRSWRWAWKWGALATILALILSPFIARYMRIDSPWPVLVSSLAILMLFVRPVTDGTLQGLQKFWGLSTVMVLQSILRLFFAALLIYLGLQAVGALLALPLATATVLLVAIWFLRPYFPKPEINIAVPDISLRYSAMTLVGMLAFAVLVNVDAIVVKRFFSESIAGDYGTVVTLGKINLFATLGIGMVLFPKATQRYAAGEDPRPVLAISLAATLLLGLLSTAVFFLASGFIVQSIFSDTYNDPGLVLGFVGLATTLYAGISIWLNYALSLNRRGFIIALAVIVIAAIIAMMIFHATLLMIATIMIITGLAGNLAGVLTTLSSE